MFDIQRISEAYALVCESERRRPDVKFKFVDEWDAKRIVASISRRTDNPRMDVRQFKKYYRDPRKRWFGMFENGKCMALAVLKRTPNSGSVRDIVLLAEIQSIVKGYGKPLIEEILKRYPNVWWAADPEGGASLLRYYRQFDGMSERKVGLSGWTGKPQSFFYRIGGKRRNGMLKSLLDSIDCSNLRPKALPLSDAESRRVSGFGKGETFFTTLTDGFGGLDEGDLLSLPRGRRGFVTRTWSPGRVSEHPFADELTAKEREFLEGRGRMKVLEVRVL